MTQNQTLQFIEKKLKNLAELVQSDDVLSQNSIPKYLSKFINSVELVLNPIENNGQQNEISGLKTTTDEILKDIYNKGLLTANEIAGHQADIDNKINILFTTDVKNRPDIVDDIGVILTKASSDSDKRKEVHEMCTFLAKESIPYGLDERAKHIPISEFFTFPFGEYQGPDEEEWFSFHTRYLQMAVKQKKLEKSKYTRIINAINHIPKQKYKRYYNIFPNDKFEQTTFMAIYDLWKNKTFENIKILP